MLEHVPHWLGALLHNVRAGADKLAVVQPELIVRGHAIDLASPAFADHARLPERFTADGAGVSPPLVWGDVPEGTMGLALLVEDPDAPAMQPLVHALIWNVPSSERRLAEGAIVRDGKGSDDGRDVSRNSFFAEGWLAPDPPTGHGVHDYVFQLFALSEVADLGANPGRADIVKAMAGRVLGVGVLVGTYSRGEHAEIGRSPWGVTSASPA